MSSVMKINKNAQKFAENWFPLKSINNGAIQLDNGYSVTGVKIKPKNIFILDRLSQERVLFSLQSFYNTINYEFWIMVVDRPVDINVYVSQLQLALNQTQAPALRKVLLQDINKANIFMSKEVGVTDTEYFLLFKEKKEEIIQKKLQSIITNLANCDLQASQVSDEDLRGILDNFFNDGEKVEFGSVIG